MSSTTAPSAGGPVDRQTTRRRAEALRRRLMRVAELVTTPLVPADYLDLFDPLRPGADLRGRVVAVHPETEDAATVVIRPGADWAGHVPGQYVRVGIDVDGVRLWRAYSLTHGPRADGYISITVKAVPDGKVSNHLVHRAPVGALVHLEQAAGDFVLPLPPAVEPGPSAVEPGPSAVEPGPSAVEHVETPVKVLFVTAGSGVTPVIGMLRNLYPVAESGPVHLSRSAAYDVVVVHLAPSEPQSIFHRDLCALHDAGLVRLATHYDDRDGMFDVAMLDRLVPDLAERITLACGPAGLLDALEKHHADRGLELRTERFRPVVLATGEGGTVTFERQGTVVEADGSTPLLTAGEDAGVLMPSGCRMGVCFGCVVPLVEGTVRDLRSGDLTAAVEGDGVNIQTCISAAAGDCRLAV